MPQYFHSNNYVEFEVGSNIYRLSISDSSLEKFNFRSQMWETSNSLSTLEDDPSDTYNYIYDPQEKIVARVGSITGKIQYYWEGKWTKIPRDSSYVPGSALGFDPNSGSGSISTTSIPIDYSTPITNNTAIPTFKRIADGFLLSMFYSNGVDNNKSGIYAQIYKYNEATDDVIINTAINIDLSSMPNVWTKIDFDKNENNICVYVAPPASSESFSVKVGSFSVNENDLSAIIYDQITLDDAGAPAGYKAGAARIVYLSNNYFLCIVNKNDSNMQSYGRLLKFESSTNTISVESDWQFVISSTPTSANLFESNHYECGALARLSDTRAVCVYDTTKTSYLTVISADFDTGVLSYTTEQIGHIPLSSYDPSYSAPASAFTRHANLLELDSNRVAIVTHRYDTYLPFDRVSYVESADHFHLIYEEDDQVLKSVEQKYGISVTGDSYHSMQDLQLIGPFEDGTLTIFGSSSSTAPRKFYKMLLGDSRSFSLIDSYSESPFNSSNIGLSRKGAIKLSEKKWAIVTSKGLFAFTLT